MWTLKLIKWLAKKVLKGSDDHKRAITDSNNCIQEHRRAVTEKVIGNKLFTMRFSLWILGWTLYKGLANTDLHLDQERDPTLHNLVMIVTQTLIYLTIRKITLTNHTTLHVFKGLKL